MKKKSNNDTRYITQYQVARALSIFAKLMTDWHGPELWARTPDNIMAFLQTSRDHAVIAKKELIKMGYKFKKGTENAL